MRGWIVTAAACLAALPAAAQVNLEAANGTRYRIQDRAGGALDAPEAFAAWPALCVRVCQDCDGPCAEADTYDVDGAVSTPELNGRQLALAPVELAGLIVTRKVFVPSDGPANADGFVRYLDIFENPTGDPITVMVRLGATGAGAGRLGAGDRTRAWRTSDDDAQVEPGDRWVVTDDDLRQGGIGAVAHLIHGAGARVLPARIGLGLVAPDDPAAFAWEYRDLVVQPHSTVALMTVLVHESLRDAAIVEVRNLLGMPTEVLFGLTDAERGLIRNFNVAVQNASPVAEAGGPYNGFEGQQIQLSAVGSVDPDGRPLQYEWDLDGDGEFDDAGGANALVLFPDDGSYEVRVRVTDPGGLTDVDTARVVVLNVDPRIEGVQTDPLPIDEGTELNVEIDASDTPADPLTFDFDWDGNGAWDEQGVAHARWRHRYERDGHFRARVRVRDGDGGQAIHEFPVSVRNVAPEIFDVVTNSPSLEGAAVTIQVVARDPGGDPVTYAYDLDGDGDFDESGVGLDRVETRFPNDGLFPVLIRLTDDEGAAVEREERISILNARPVINNITNDGPVPEGSPVRIEVAATDPGDDPLTYSFDFDNDGEFEDDVVDQEEPFTAHVFTQQGFYTVGVRVRDDSGDFVLGVAEVEVLNAPPAGVLHVPESVDEGEVFLVRAEAADPGADPLTYDWDVDGDGAYDLLATPDAARDIELRRDGRVTVRCRVRDGDGGEAVLEGEVLVRNVPPSLQLVVRSPADEGAEVTVRAVATDPGDDALTYSFDFDGDGVFDVDGSDEAEATTTFPDQGSYTVRVQVDDGLDLARAEATVDIVNVAPTARLEASSPVPEGDEIVLRAEVSDPGDDTVTLAWDLDGDGEVDVEGEPDRERRVPAADDARYFVTLVASDEDGGEGSARAEVIVTNVPPELVDLAEPPPALENQAYQLFMVADDPGGENDPLRYSLIDPPPGIEIVAETGRIEWTPSYEDYLNSPVRVRVRVDDGDGGTDETEVAIPVLPEDRDADGLPDTYERRTCDADGACLDPEDAADAAADPDGDGRDNRAEFADGSDPFTYEGPSTPEPLAPADGQRIQTLTPELVVGPVEGHGDAAVSIVFALYDSMEALEVDDAFFMSDPVPVADDAERTAWAPAVGLLLEDTWYWWRARSVQGVAQSPWSPARGFFTNSVNQRPEAPRLRAPADGSRVPEAKPTLEALPATDPDGDELRYVFRIYRQAPDGPTAEFSEMGALEGDVVRYTPEAAFTENVVYLWEVVATDELGEVSEPSERWSFTVDTSNQAPSPPQIRAPEEGRIVSSRRPVFVAGGSVDGDGPELAYVFRVRDAAGEVLAESDPVPPEGDDASWEPPVDLVEDADHTLEVWATDGQATSDVVARSFFVSSRDDPPPAPEPQSPADGAIVPVDEVILVWSKVADPERSAVVYEVTLCPEGGDCETIPRAPNRNAALSGLEVDRVYTWSVVAIDEAGNASPPSNPRKFTTAESGGGAAPSEGCGCRVEGGSSSPWALVLLAVGFAIRRRRRLSRGP